VYLQFEAKWPEEEGLYLVRRNAKCLPGLVWYSKEADAVFSYPGNNRRWTRDEYESRARGYMLIKFACLAIEKPVVDFCIEDPMGGTDG